MAARTFGGDIGSSVSRVPTARSMALLAATSSAARAQAPEPKSLTIVVGSTPGGGYDVYARLLGRHISRHLRFMSRHR